MDIPLSRRVQPIRPSPTLAIAARAKALRAEGKHIIDLGAGEPDFDTPEPVKAAAVRALQAGATKYTAVDGIPGLKRAVADKFRRDNDLAYAPEQILVSAGAKHSFYNLAQALLDPGDEAVIPAPYWVSYPPMVRLAEATPVTVAAPQAQGFKITAAQLEAAMTARTRLLVLNSPANPTGAAYTRAELSALGAVLRRHPKVVVATDDIYEHIYWGEEPFSNMVNACPDLGERAVVLNGVSKAYAMTGWRIGYAAGPAALIGAMKTIQSQSTSNPAAIAQAAAQAALEGPQGCVERLRQAFRERHDVMVGRLNALSGVRCAPGSGTFYTFPRVQEAIDCHPAVKDDQGLAETLLQEAHVAAVPGSAFGAPGHLRLSFATGRAELEEALARLGRFFNG